ncbi:HRDC domain-containing protein [Myxococcota bacterium]|nr:HRDC domain-containing protein [Myxococcota bacterium]
MWQWIDRDDIFAAWWASVREEQEYAVDTESDGVHSYRPRLCLMQVATRGQVALLDLLALGEASIAILREFLSDAQRLKVFHSAVNDLLNLQRDYQIHAQGLFDTEIAAGFLALPGRGLSALLERFFGLQITKQFQTLDWSIRPLPEEALAYAATDVRHLLELKDLLLEQLEECGWLDAALEESRNIAQQTHYEEKLFDSSGFLRLKGAKELSARQLQTLHALYVARHLICEEINKAAFLVAPDHALIEMAVREPRTVKELSALRGMKPAQIREYGELLIEAVVRSQGPLRPLPKKPRTQKGRVSESSLDVEHFDRLRDWRNALAEAEGIEGGLLFSGQLLKNCLLHRPRDLVSLAKVPGMSGWRVRRYGRALLDALQN